MSTLIQSSYKYWVPEVSVSSDVQYTSVVHRANIISTVERAVWPSSSTGKEYAGTVGLQNPEGESSTRCVSLTCPDSALSYGNLPRFPRIYGTVRWSSSNWRSAKLHNVVKFAEFQFRDDNVHMMKVGGARLGHFGHLQFTHVNCNACTCQY